MANLETLQRPAGLCRPARGGRQHDLLNIARRANRVRPHAFGALAGGPARDFIDGGDVKRRRMTNRARIE